MTPTLQRTHNPVIHRTITILIAFLVSFPIGALAADAVTELRVNDLIKRVDEATTKRDIPALLACFANDAIITSDWLSAEGVSKKKFSRKEYGDYVKDQFPTAIKRERTHSNTKITITDNGSKASVAAETKEAVTLPGAAISVPTLEVINLVQHSNELLIKSLDISFPKDSK